MNAIMIAKVAYVVVAIAVVMFVTFRKNMKSKLSNVEYAYTQTIGGVKYPDYNALMSVGVSPDKGYTPNTSEDVDVAIAYLSEEEEDKDLISTPAGSNVLVYTVLICVTAISLIGLVAMCFAYAGKL